MCIINLDLASSLRDHEKEMNIASTTCYESKNRFRKSFQAIVSLSTSHESGPGCSKARLS